MLSVAMSVLPCLQGFGWTGSKCGSMPLAVTWTGFRELGAASPGSMSISPQRGR